VHATQVETMKKLYEDADHEVKTKGYVDADKVPIPVRFGCRHGFDECTGETCAGAAKQPAQHKILAHYGHPKQ